LLGSLDALLANKGRVGAGQRLPARITIRCCRRIFFVAVRTSHIRTEFFLRFPSIFWIFLDLGTRSAYLNPLTASTGVFPGCQPLVAAATTAAALGPQSLWKLGEDFAG
jgi:hypothetical protein